MTALLEIRGLDAGYDGSRVLHRVDLDVAEGQVLTLLGRNGVGKTTLVMSVMGIVQRTAGSVRFSGKDLSGARPDLVVKSGIGLIPQGRRVFAPLTVEENLRIAVRRRSSGPWSIARIYEMLPRLAERRSHRGDQLSGGEQQMLAIGRALLGNPRLILIDEPSDGLAPLIVRQVSDVIRSLRDEGVTILLVEQDLVSALKVADAVVVMDKGEIMHRASAEEFRVDQQRAADLLGVT